MKPHRDRKFDGYRAKRAQGATDWIFAVPAPVVGKAQRFVPAEWDLTEHGPAATWDQRWQPWLWNVRTIGGERTEVGCLFRGRTTDNVKSLGGLRWITREVPERGVQWVLFARYAACSRGLKCPVAQKRARHGVELYGGELAMYLRHGYDCPLALLEPGVWKRVGQIDK